LHKNVYNIIMYFAEKSIENKIIELLSGGSYRSPDLVVIASKDLNVTPQGVYKAISFLIEQEVVIKNSMKLSLNSIWLEKLRLFSDKVSKNYDLKEFDDFLLLKDREKVTYSFKDAIRLDNQWLNFIIAVSKKFSDNPISIWNPHHWFIFGRPESESVLFDWFNKQQRDVFLTIGGNYSFDKIAQKKIESKNIRVNTAVDAIFPNNDYVTVIGDYIISTRYSEIFSNKIESFFKNNQTLDDAALSELKRIVQKPQRAKIIFERNKSKALKYSKKMMKDFYVDEKIRDYLK
jgi:hypothetical protein